MKGTAGRGGRLLILADDGAVLNGGQSLKRTVDDAARGDAVVDVFADELHATVAH